MVTRDIRPSTGYTVCDVCGRTLLRGERAQVYLDGGDRRSVCELCTTRAVQEGWIREGTMPPMDGRDGGSDRRRSLMGRLRRRRERKPPPPQPAAPVEDFDEEEHQVWDERPPPPSRPRRRLRERLREEGRSEPRTREPRTREPRTQEPRTREPRRVHAVPTSDEHKMADAVELFNASEHRRTVAGVARSLGAPEVSVRPVAGRPSMVNVVAAWELCWYRYEIDLSDDVPTVRVADQGIELDELAPEEREANAFSDENGSLTLDS